MPPNKPRKPKKLFDRPIYFVVRWMVDPATGESIGCLVPECAVNQRLMRERKYRVGDKLRATITSPRNGKFHRLVHHLGTVVKRNIDGFEHLDSHAVIKQLQRESGVCCDIERINAAPVVTAVLSAAEVLLGEVAARMLATVLPEIKTIEVLTPQSLAYDCMDESDFRLLWQGICQHIITRYWPSMTEEQINTIVDLMPHSEGEA